MIQSYPFRKNEREKEWSYLETVSLSFRTSGKQDMYKSGYVLFSGPNNSASVVTPNEVNALCKSKTCSLTDLRGQGTL